MRIAGLIGIVLACTVAIVVAIAALAKRFSDGPLGPIPGGALRSGSFLSDPEVDWTFAKDTKLAQLQLVNPLASRTTGILVHDGQLYIPCDLGFIWRRVSPPAKWIMALVWRVKRWHEDALRDGRVVIRIRGQRYERMAVRVEDPALLVALRREVEQGAEEFLSSPLADTDADPNAIWFFRLEPRPIGENPHTEHRE